MPPREQSPSSCLWVHFCHCLALLLAQKVSVSFCLLHAVLHWKSSAWLPAVPGGRGTALPNYRLQNKPIQFSAKANYITNNNFAITCHLFLSGDFYLKHVQRDGQ